MNELSKGYVTLLLTIFDSLRIVYAKTALVAGTREFEREIAVSTS
jgi:hypothetical protein